MEDVRTRAACSAWTSTSQGHTLHVYNVHLGTAILERRYQAERLATIVSDRHVGGAEARARRLQRVDARADDDAAEQPAEERRSAGLSEAAPHVSGLFPILHLDHIYYAGALEIVGIELPRTRLSLVASDHLPLVATVTIGKA